MRIKSCFTKLAVVLSSVLVAACGSNDEHIVSTSSDCAITNVALGTLYRTMHSTTVAGKDTTYTTNFSGRYFPMSIDQQKLEIYNVDSLPINTHINKTILSITADGSISIRPLNAETDIRFSSTDSIDFSTPRNFTILSTDGTSKKTYKIKMNVHQVESEKFTWNLINKTDNNLKECSQQRSFLNNGYIYLFGIENEKAFLLKASTADELAWEKTEIGNAASFSISSLQSFDGLFYTLANGLLSTSKDGISWNSIQPNLLMDKLVAAGKKEIYGLKDGKLYGSVNGLHWEEQKLDSSFDNFPTDHLSSISFTSRINKDIEFLLLGGTKGKESKLWKKENYFTINEITPWSFCPNTEENKYSLPVLTSLTFLNYDNSQLAIGFQDHNLTPFFLSKDGGLTWIKSKKTYTLPTSLTPPSNYSCIVDSDNFIWLFCGGTGEVWKGRLNRLGFENNSNSFE
ncbi:MAG: DUF6242 domain-containing protein [Bacteroidaceae bacterium]